MAQWWENPGAFPGSNYDPSGLRHNPAGTIPFPQPQSPPVGLWEGGRASLSWSLVNGLWTAAWQSPLFDLRPDIRAAQSGITGGTPIWRPMGAGGALWVQVEHLTTDATATTDLNVTVTEFAHVNDPNAVVSVTTDSDITSEFVGGNAAALLQFLPPGHGYPVRYYRVQLLFSYLDARVGPPPFAVSASYY
jgi:hypothetical protein